MSYTELHFHLLPGIDDGPATLAESVELAAAAFAEGTRTILATPHIHPAFSTDPLEIPARVRELREGLKRARVRVDVLSGAEVAQGMAAALDERALRAIAQGPQGRRWLLLEAPFEGLDESYTAAADELRDRGYAVVVAHPERAVASLDAWRVIQHELDVGSAMQVNAWSVAGLYGSA